MSRENVVRQHVALRGRRRRTLEEHLSVRFPALSRWGGSAFSRLPPRSRLRRWLLRRGVGRVYEAFNRGDMAVFLLGNHPDVEFHTASDPQGGPFAIGLEDVYRGHEGLVSLRRQWAEASDDFHVETDEVIDCGERCAVLLRLLGRGRASGLNTDQPLGQVITWRDGVAWRIDMFWSFAEALEAVGLRE